jgi:hypothetical protein
MAFLTRIITRSSELVEKVGMAEPATSALRMAGALISRAVAVMLRRKP